MAKTEDFWLEGLIPAVFTPFDKEGELDLPKIEDYCEYLLSNDIKAVYVNGATGEAKSLTKEERKAVAEKWIHVARGRMKIVVHIGSMNLKESKELARHAVDIGADAIASLPTLFFKPQSVDALVSYCQSVASVAPSLPFYYYHLPAFTGVDLNMEDFMKAAMEKIPSMKGIKFSSQDLVDMIGVRFAGNVNILFGCDHQLISGLVTGAHGGIGSLYNFMPKVFQRMLKDIQNNDMESARKEQYKAQQLCRLMIRYGEKLGGTVSACKHFMKLVGLDVGPAREPMRSMTQSEHDMFMKDIEKLGFHSWDPANYA